MSGCGFDFHRTAKHDRIGKRLRGRGTEAEEVIQKRLATASGELKDAPNYKYLVVNDQVETAAQEILTILAAEQIHQINKEEKVKEVLES